MLKNDLHDLLIVCDDLKDFESFWVNFATFEQFEKVFNYYVFQRYV